MASVYEVADKFVETYASLSPVGATYMGIPGYDHLMNDSSPEAAEEMAKAERAAIREMEAAEPQNDRERICRDTFLEELRLGIEQQMEHLRRHARGVPDGGIRNPARYVAPDSCGLCGIDEPDNSRRGTVGRLV